MKKLVVLLSLLAFTAALSSEVFARAGGGKSSGFRSTNPQRYSQPAPQRPSQEAARPMQQPLQKPSFFSSGLFKMLVGGLFIGGILSLLMGHGFQFGAPGLIEILLIGGLLFFIFRRFMRSRQTMEPAYATASGAGAVALEPGPTEHPGGTPASFDTSLLTEMVRRAFSEIQAAWTRGDLVPVRDLLTDRMFEYLDQQLREIKVKGLRNVIEIVYFQRCEVVDVQDEAGTEVVTVRIEALLRDYTLDGSGTVVEGSKGEPAEAKEFWTFVGSGGKYRLDDIQQA